MGEHRISALEEYLHDQAGVTPDVSPRWLFINLLDELNEGFLAYRCLYGMLEGTDAILTHYFWVFGVLQDVERDEPGAFFRPFSAHVDPVPQDTHAWLRGIVFDALPNIPASGDPRRSGDVIAAFGRDTIAAISVGHDGSGWKNLVLYWNPFFTDGQACALLRATAAADMDA